MATMDDLPRLICTSKGALAVLARSSRDVVAITMDFIRSNTDETRMVVVSSTYFPHEKGDSFPPGLVVKLEKHCQEKGLPLIVEYDANAQHTI